MGVGVCMSICASCLGMERTARQVVVEADIEGSVGVRGKDDSRLAGDISGTTVLVADGIFNLRTHTHERVMSSLAFSLSLSVSPGGGCCLSFFLLDFFGRFIKRCVTYEHVHGLAVALVTAHGGRDDDEGVPRDEIPAAAALTVGGHVELQSLDPRDQEQHAADVLQQCPW